MKISLLLLAVLLGSIAIGSTVSAQVKIGYTNVELVLAHMPESKTVEASLQNYQQKLAGRIKLKEGYGSQKLQEYLEKREAGRYSPAEQEAAEKELQQLDQEVQKLAQDSEHDLSAKRQELMGPILTKLQNAIDAVAREGGFSLIVNKTTGAGVSTIAYGPGDGDITEALFRKLNIKIPESVSETYGSGSRSPAVPKIGFTNIEVILANMPEWKAAESSLQSFQRQLAGEIKAKDDQVKQKYQEFLEKKNANGFSEGQQEAAEKELLNLDQEVQNLAKVSEQRLATKRQQLELPAIIRLESAIDAIAREGGYSHILNQTTSDGASTLLFGPDDGNITNLVFEKLGLNSLDSGVRLSGAGLQPPPKIGYTNVEFLLAYLPESAEIDKDVNRLTDALTRQLEVKQRYYRMQLEEYSVKERDGTFSPEGQKAAADELKKLGDEIQESAASAEQKVFSRRMELFKPVQQKMQAAIDSVAREQGFTFVLNQVVGGGVPSILYGREDTDLTTAIAGKLGIPMPSNNQD